MFSIRRLTESKAALNHPVGRNVFHTWTSNAVSFSLSSLIRRARYSKVCNCRCKLITLLYDVCWYNSGRLVLISRQILRGVRRRRRERELWVGMTLLSPYKRMEVKTVKSKYTNGINDDGDSVLASDWTTPHCSPSMSHPTSHQIWAITKWASRARSHTCSSACQSFLPIPKWYHHAWWNQVDSWIDLHHLVCLS